MAMSRVIIYSKRSASMRVKNWRKAVKVKWYVKDITRWYVELAERAEPKLNGHGQLEWLERMEQELDNLRSALEWSLHNDFDLGLRITNALMRFWVIRDHESNAFNMWKNCLQPDLLDPTPFHARALGLLPGWRYLQPPGKQMMPCRSWRDNVT